MPGANGRVQDDGRADLRGRTRVAVGLGPALRRAWVGYQRRLDEAMAAAGFDDRRFPDGQVLRLCSDAAGATIAAVGRELDITRQGAGKVVNRLRDRGYLSIAESSTSGREKSVTLTPRGAAYLEAQRKAVRAIEQELRSELGRLEFDGIYRLLDILAEGQETSMRGYLQRSVSSFADPLPPSGTSAHG